MKAGCAELSDCLRRDTPDAELAVFNAGAIRIDDIITAGPVTQYDIIRMLPFGGPVVAPSANPSSRVSPTTAEHVRRHLGDKVKVILDGGRCSVGIESAVVSFLDEVPLLLRAGGVSRAEIEAIIGPVKVESHSARPHAPSRCPPENTRP